MEDKIYENISNPLELDLQPLEEFLNKNCLPYQDINFLVPQVLKIDDDVNLKGAWTRLMPIRDYYGGVDIKKKDRQVSVYCKMGGLSESCAENTIFYNNRTNEPCETKYEIAIKKANSNKIKIASFSPDKIYDVKEFRKETGCLCNLNSNEILTFIKQEVQNTDKHINEYANSGKIAFHKNDWLWENAAFIDNKLYTEMDDYGNIKIGDKEYVRAKVRARRKIPKYYPNTKSIKEVITSLCNNINISWYGAIEPFLAFGFSLIAPFYDAFWAYEGMGALGFIGETECGKSEISNLIAGVFGADKTFFSASRTTVVGIEQSLNAYNCIPQFIDDISRCKLQGDNFIDLLKQVANGIQNNKGRTGQESGALPPCANFGFSANTMPSEKAEIFNRMLFIYSNNFKFNPDEYKYFGCADKELSCILPYILKYKSEEIREKHQHYKKWLKSEFGNDSDRMSSQLAIALTGLNLLSEIAECELNIPYDKLAPYVVDCLSKFKSFKNPLEKILEAFPTLIWEGRITANNQYKVTREDNRIILSFHKTSICKAYNRYYVDDKSQEINSSQLKETTSDLYEIIKFNKPVNINDNRGHGIRLDITNHHYAEAIYTGRYRM